MWWQRRQRHPTPALLPGKSHGQRSLVGCSPWGHEESDTTERLHFHFSLSCIGEGNGNPLQCSCLENPRDRGAWWAAVYGVAQSRTRLKQLSSSSSSRMWWALTVYITVTHKDQKYIKPIYIHPSVKSSIIYKNQDMATTQVSINRRMDKEGDMCMCVCIQWNT